VNQEVINGLFEKFDIFLSPEKISEKSIDNIIETSFKNYGVRNSFPQAKNVMAYVENIYSGVLISGDKKKENIRAIFGDIEGQGYDENKVIDIVKQHTKLSTDETKSEIFNTAKTTTYKELLSIGSYDKIEIAKKINSYIMRNNSLDYSAEIDIESIADNVVLKSNEIAEEIVMIKETKFFEHIEKGLNIFALQNKEFDKLENNINELLPKVYSVVERALENNNSPEVVEKLKEKIKTEVIPKFVTKLTEARTTVIDIVEKVNIESLKAVVSKETGIEVNIEKADTILKVSYKEELSNGSGIEINKVNIIEVNMSDKDYGQARDKIVKDIKNNRTETKIEELKAEIMEATGVMPELSIRKKDDKQYIDISYKLSKTMLGGAYPIKVNPVYMVYGPDS
jgi:hypothetical protein